MSNAKRSTIEVQGTSIAILSHERQDFLSKLSIAYKEARESHHWLRLLRDSDILDNRQAGSVIEDCAELLKLSGSIIRTTKSNIPNS
jgi:four helix bundle protein